MINRTAIRKSNRQRDVDNIGKWVYETSNLTIVDARVHRTTAPPTTLDPCAPLQSGFDRVGEKDRDG